MIVKVAFHQLTENIKHVAKRPFLDKTLERKAVWDKWMKQDLNNDNSPLRPERLMKAINANLKDDAIISAECWYFYSMVYALLKLICK